MTGVLNGEYTQYTLCNMGKSLSLNIAQELTTFFKTSFIDECFLAVIQRYIHMISFWVEELVDY